MFHGRFSLPRPERTTFVDPARKKTAVSNEKDLQRIVNHDVFRTFAPDLQVALSTYRGGSIMRPRDFDSFFGDNTRSAPHYDMSFLNREEFANMPVTELGWARGKFHPGQPRRINRCG